MKVVLAGNQIIVRSSVLDKDLTFVFATKDQAASVFPVICDVNDYLEKAKNEVFSNMAELVDLREEEVDDA